MNALARYHIVGNADINSYEAELLIDLTMFFKEGGVLPRAGGIFDQDPTHVRMIKAGLNAIAERRQKEDKAEEAKAKRKGR
jgi:hypothetical protein